jgi:hypothetical protein
VVFPTVVFGGASILWHWITRHITYYQNPLRQRLWRAGHAHAGVLLLLSLLALMLVDLAELRRGGEAGRPAHDPCGRHPSPRRLLPLSGEAGRQPPEPAHQPRLRRRISLTIGTIGTITFGIGLLRAA